MMMHYRTIVAALLLLPVCLQAKEQVALEYLESHRGEYRQLAQKMWDLAEVGYQETESTALLQEQLADAGFEISAGVADIPTAFLASYGEGKPVIGILAEFDALPGISQSARPVRDVIEDKSAGHACGHHLFGSGSSAAAIAVKKWLDETGHEGTVRLYGTPAEEGGSGKVYMVRAGLFDDADVVLHWHPSDKNAANPSMSLANKSARFSFTGVSAHAAAAPHRGRSALDGVEAMNHMVNMLREHIPETSRIHYVITEGGSAPNVVPDFAQVYYYVRHPDADVLKTIWDRVMTIAGAAADGTGTEVEAEVMHGNHSLLPNKTLARVMHKNLSRVGGVTWNEEEQEFAGTLFESLDAPEELLGTESEIEPMSMVRGKGSTDVGDVSWAVPVTGLRTATWVPGTAAHSWQAIAAGGTSIGVKGMDVAAKTLALTTIELMQSPDLIEAATREFNERRGEDFEYEALLGDRDPPLDYRR